MNKTTESDSNYNHLEKMSVSDLLKNINKEDKTVPLAIEKALPKIEAFINAALAKMKEGGGRKQETRNAKGVSSSRA